MKLSTGKVAFPIEFDNGAKTAIYFNPNDPDLMIRMKNFEGRVFERIKDFEDVELTNEGTPADISEIETFEDMQNIIKEELDTAFGGSVSSEVFKYCSPFAIVGGQYFIIQFIEAITPEIEKHIKKSASESQKRMAKHIDKYRK
jgi:hypothetical protein